jgi:hypothetical protein
MLEVAGNNMQGREAINAVRAGALEATSKGNAEDIVRKRKK